MALPINRSSDEVAVCFSLADVAATTPAYTVAPVKGYVSRIYTVVEGTTNGAPVLTFNINGTNITGGTITIASGGGAGDVDSVEITHSATSFVQEGQYIKVTSDGAGSTTVNANIVLVLEQA